MTTLTGQQVRDLTGTDMTDLQLALFIQEGLLVADVLLLNKGLDQRILDSIALYAAGHAYVLSVEAGGITYAKTGMSEERYKSFGYETYGFMTTRFGQMACALDSTGTLFIMSKKEKIGFMFDTYTNRKAPPVVNEAQ